MAKINQTSAPIASGSNEPSKSNSETSTEKTSERDSEKDTNDGIYGLVWISICGYLIYRIIYTSYRIRMASIDEYGPVIHEFDPYFNYRATEVRNRKR